MGEMFGILKLDFEGTDSEKQMMERLLFIMALDSSEDYWRLPIDEDFDIFSTTALTGPFRKEWGDLELAPQLFGALFPASRFRYTIEREYSNCLSDSDYLTAVFEDNILMIRSAYLYPLDEEVEEEIKRFCREKVNADPEAKARLEKYKNERGIDGDIDWDDWYSILYYTVDDPKELMASYYNFERKLPARNKEYERSFFLEGDLQEYLVSEQIRAMDMSLAEYIKAFSFTKAQYQHFIQVATECGFTEMSAFLLEEMQQRVESGEGN